MDVIYFGLFLSFFKQKERVLANYYNADLPPF